MASIGGNLMQRPRCLYFRDVSTACNRRTPGTGCSAIDGRNRTHAILGTSDQCVATHPSDLAVALTALDAVVIVRDTNGEHLIRISDFFRQPGTTPNEEHNLRPGQLIVAVTVPVRPESRRSGYLKVRDRESYEFALTSAAVALDIQAGAVRSARVAVGGVGTVPWRLPAVERAVTGHPPSAELWRTAAARAADGAKPLSENGFKVELLKRTVERQLATVAEFAMTHPAPTAQPVMGQPVTRVDGRRKVTGEALYAADNPVPNLVYAALVGATVARGGVERIDSAAAVRHPDVLRVLTDFGGVKLPYDPRQVSCFGHPVAVVESPPLWKPRCTGTTLVEVRYGTGPQLTNIDAQQAVHQKGSRTPRLRPGQCRTTRCARAPVVSDLRYSIARNNHNPMELPATIASWDGDRLTVWDKVQGINNSRQAYATAFGVPTEHVRVISPFVGGAFGSAGSTWPHQLLAALAARQLRRPVKLVLTRKQMYSGIGFRPTSRQRLAIGADRSGRIDAIIHEGHTETSRYNSYGRQSHRSGEVPLPLAEHAFHVSHCAAGHQPADLHARAGRHQRRFRAGIRHGRPCVSPRHGSDRVADAQRTRPRSGRRFAVFDSAADRLPAARSRDIRLVATQPDTPCGP